MKKHEHILPPSSVKEEQPITIKSNCTDCSHYNHCPRMRGESVCYGKQEVVVSNPKKTDVPPKLL